MNVCPRHFPFMLFVDKLCLKFYNYICVNGYVKMYIILCYALFHIIFALNKIYLKSSYTSIYLVYILKPKDYLLLLLSIDVIA